MGSISGSFITIFCVRGELRFHLTFKYSTLVLPRCVLLATFWLGRGGGGVCPSRSSFGLDCENAAWSGPFITWQLRGLRMCCVFVVGG